MIASQQSGMPPASRAADVVLYEFHSKSAERGAERPSPVWNSRTYRAGRLPLPPFPTLSPLLNHLGRPSGGLCTGELEGASRWERTSRTDEACQHSKVFVSRVPMLTAPLLCWPRWWCPRAWLRAASLRLRSVHDLSHGWSWVNHLGGGGGAQDTLYLDTYP